MIWPKKPGVYAPYHARAAGSPEEFAVQWQKERAAFLESLAKQPTHFTDAGINRLKSLDYRGFCALYAGDRRADEFEAYALGAGLYVGHVGIVELDASGTPGR